MRLLNKQRVGKATTGTYAEVKLNNLAAMPKQTRLFFAHVLDQGNPDLLLLKSDLDVPDLLSTGWLMLLPCSIPGFISLRMKPEFWRQLKWLRSGFLTELIRNELESYRKRKGTVYPWTW